jgi:NADH:ubiquinone oxidoreductase subunit 3 (subunit A)
MSVTPVQTPAGLEPAFDLAAYYPVLIYAGVVALFAFGSVTATQLFPFKPRKPTRVKLMPYESGMDPVGSARMQFDIKFHIIAITFLIFDVELLLLYPWAVIAFSQAGEQLWREVFGGAAVVTVLVFIGLLTLGYVYEWRKGTFSWR